MKTLKSAENTTSADAAGELGQGEAPGQEAAGNVARAERHRMIAEAAYYRAECRGFESGFELDDWLAAEAQLDKSCSSDANGAQRKGRAGRL